MTPTTTRKAFDEDSGVLIPGLEYARSLIDTAILICRHVDQPRPQTSGAGNPPPKKLD